MPGTGIIKTDSEEGQSDISDAPATPPPTAVVVRGEISVSDLVEQMHKINDAMRDAMQEGIHFGRIPGISKPTLLKPGAEKLCVLFRLDPDYEGDEIWHEDGHLTVISKCTLTHIQTGLVIGHGRGLCSTREQKYAYRKGGRVCPACGAEGTILKSKYPPRENDYAGASRDDPPGWFCFGRRGGCGMNFRHDDPAITGQTEERLPNPDLADTYNTVLKMADKRALVAAVLNGTAASDVFTQDVEDHAGASAEPERPAEEDIGEFDPATALLPRAPREKEGTLGLLKNLDSGLDWGPVIAQAVQHVYGERNWRDLDRTKQSEFWRRLSNAALKIFDEAGSGDFPPVDDDLIVEGFAWAFNDVQVNIEHPPYVPPELSEHDQEIAFGEED